MYKHIIWDFDGTLYDTYPVITEAFRLELEAAGYYEPYDQILNYTKTSMTVTREHYAAKYQLVPEFFGRYKERCHEMERKLCRPFEGMEDLCKYIHDSGRRNYLFTHRSETALRHLKEHGLYPYFTDFITSKSGFERKPSPEGLLHFIDKHGMKPEEAIMVGDRELDILSGRNAGMHSCFFSEDGEVCDSADYNAKNAKEIYPIL